MKLFILLLLLQPSYQDYYSSCSSILEGSYPERTVCKCIDSQNPSAVCVESSIDTVPSDLNPSLESLNLSKNRIQALDSLFFYQELITFIVSYNRITSINSMCFQDSITLHSLDLSHNLLGEVKRKQFYGLGNLKTLDLSYNKIKHIQTGGFDNLDEIITINLSYNELNQLDNQVFSGPFITNLQYLYMEHNYIKHFPYDVFSNLRSLSTLDLSLNPLSTLEVPLFQELNSLAELRLRECSLYSIGEIAFSGLSQLRILDISHNGLNQVPSSSFHNIQALETLYIGGNLISALRPRDFNALRRLRHFSMTECKDESVSFHYLTMLKKVNLHGNPLTSLNKLLLAFYDLDSLDVTDCPLECGCSLSWLKDLLNTKPNISRQARCNYKGEFDLIAVLHEEAFSCSSQDFSLLIICSLSVGGALTLAAAVYGLVIFFRQRGRRLGTGSCTGTGYFRFRRSSSGYRKRKRLSSKAGKEDIQVLQNLNVPNNGQFIELPGLHRQEELESVQVHQTENIYEEVPEESNAVPNRFPDVKISEI
ncbi:leucine-rich repeats and immunoglobulin-like domains protein 1 isoform X2 [Eurytemora carolleeae]|uniref:leucine-rich repeats and immunoglobulin-like domains protein 1 isoform X2 n=1 Tax=Eurytemora carolleeae TaxID=1294199 RepID=UPI000C75E72C|nr:leucine-rich repeats and immunoglobulin-like domains protein 1 isoform X2 [Eurytemora carolleeae]|eukprot:XP_023340023.1 leucine-rich repeats and immunoglobulin-like domains protein 1 isoform X2 [Eurytemora affinis]